MDIYSHTVYEGIQMKALILMLFATSQLMAALPQRVLVGYWENWNSMTLTQIHSAYNVIQLAFATTKGSSNYDMEFLLPYPYTTTTFKADIATLHSQGKSVILSIGGAADPVILDSPTAVSTFVASMNAIFVQYGDAFDGIDIDFESTSLAVGTWTMSAPSQVQLNIIGSIRTIMKDYRTRTGKKMVLTMAPEVVYLEGGLSAWQSTNSNGGAYLPIIDALRDSIDLLHPQYYNAGGAGAGVVARDNSIYYDTGDPDFLTSLTETTIKGFTLVNGKGTFSGFPSSKMAIGLPAHSCNTAAGTGYVKPDSINLALHYLRGEITKPANFSYTLTQSYPDFRGLMTWSINEDALACSGVWSFALNAALQLSSSSSSSSSSAISSSSIQVSSSSATILSSSSAVPTRIAVVSPSDVRIPRITMTHSGLEISSTNSDIEYYVVRKADGGVVAQGLVFPIQGIWRTELGASVIRGNYWVQLTGKGYNQAYPVVVNH